MSKLSKSNTLQQISLEKAWNSTTEDCGDLLSAISNAVDKNLASSCKVLSVTHTNELYAEITKKSASVTLKQKKKPGNTLTYKDESIELQDFSYDYLKKAAKKYNDVYCGILYGTIQLHSCDKEIECPECNGTGVCCTCNGNKHVVCPVCGGNIKCISCNGTGKYTCENCGGDGVCPECDDGWCTCGECSGEGEVTCPDCWGSGNYIDETCNCCGGSGYYNEYKNIRCRVCNGSGRFIRECNRCEGDGIVECDNCGGDGGWTCKECNGKGTCSHCRGNGYLKCKACDGSGRCGKCKGKGEIFCPDCHGDGLCNKCNGKKKVMCPKCKGWGEYQSYIGYSISEETVERKTLCSLPINDEDIPAIKGDICFSEVIYDFFAKKANVYNDSPYVPSIDVIYNDLLKKWFALCNYSALDRFNMNNDYINVFANVYKIPVTTIVLQCNSEMYNIHVVGNNLTVFYDGLPGWGSRLYSRVGNFFDKFRIRKK